jgi:pyruvate formate lyase activating enzyme
MENSITNWEDCDDCGRCAEVCYAGGREIIGRNMTVGQLMAEIIRDVPFYDQSGGGVTFTGGEPTYQSDFLKEVMLTCKEQQIYTTVDTCGHTAWDNLRSILPLVDLYLYDVKLMDADKHKAYTSVSNRLILDNLRKLSNAGAHIIVRIPLIPGINDDHENIERCGSFLAALPQLDGVELMPYHDIGVAKYQALGMNYQLEKAISPRDEQIAQVEDLLTKYHLPVIKHLSGRTI